jgi:hypothetical protein
VDVDGQIRYTNERETEQSAKHKDRPKVNFFVLTRNRWRDRKTHVYQKCAMCKNVLRFPKIGGNHIAKCPCCDFRFEVRIKTADTVADEKKKEEQTEPLCGERVSPIRETKTPPKNTDNRK